ncbi:hypothetical protein ACFQVA_03770 [Actinomadura keratinilytica]
MSPKDARPRKGAADQVAPEYDADRRDPPRAGAVSGSTGAPRGG